MRPLLLGALLAAFVMAPVNARAMEVRAPFAVGAEATFLGLPRGHIGLLPSNGGFALTGMLVGRYAFTDHFAIDAGLGLPHAALGFGGFATFEYYGRLMGNDRGFSLALFQEVGLELGYAGADYFAREHGSFVGYGYTAAGPVAFALRFPAGVSLSLPGIPLDIYFKTVPILTFTPRVEPFYDLTLGVRVRF